MSTATDPSTWLDKYGDLLYGFALKSVKNPDLAKDLVQDTFVSALDKLDTFKGDSAVSTWLTAILKNKVVDHYRKASTRTTSSTDNLEEVVNAQFNSFSIWRVFVPNWARDPEEAVEHASFIETLKDCLKKLPELSRQALELRTMEGAKTADICKILDIRPSNLGVTIYRARMALRTCMERNWHND
ncbi:MAG: sigma-70 family RNA polymerase sigma factor [Bdellovibrionales bacterium]|nr:sigma-70 family RNA polymerase sigma factor [Bdellovibrionales bacterium]